MSGQITAPSQEGEMSVQMINIPVSMETSGQEPSHLGQLGLCPHLKVD